MKKILVTASTFPRWINDTEPKFIYDLCKEYTKYFDVTVMVPAAINAKDQEIMEGIKVLRYHYFPIKKFETLCYPGAIVPRIKENKLRIILVPFLFLAMKRNIKRHINEYDIVHSNWFIPQGIVQAKFNKPYILTGLGGDVTSLNFGILKKLKKKALANASIVTVVSKDLQDKIIQEYNYEGTQVIPMGFDFSVISSDRYDKKIFNTNKKVVLFVGRLVEKKGTHILIKAMKGKNAKLVIVGDGPLKSVLQKEANKMIEDIEFVGAKSKEELAVMYASCDIFCAPSIVAQDGDKDGLPVAIIEAMASGASVIASKLGGISELIQDGFNGILIEPGNVDMLSNKIDDLLCNEKLKTKISYNAKVTAKEYDFRKIAIKYKEIIDKVIRLNEGIEKND